MYCVTCDKNGVLMHADTIYRGDALCRDHAVMRREMIEDGTNPNPREVDAPAAEARALVDALARGAA